MNRVRVSIPDGNSLDLTVTWTDKEGAAESPTSVRYQVFDARTTEAVSEIVDVPNPESEMTFTVAGTDLPGNTASERKLVIDVEGTFASATDSHTEPFEVFVRRVLPFVAL